MTTHFDPNDTALARRHSIAELCAAWTTSQDEIKQAFALLHAAENRMKQFFGDSTRSYSMAIFDRGGNYRRPDLEDPAPTCVDLERQIWCALVQRLELRKMMSLARVRDLDKQLETGKGLPPLTLDNVLTMLETTLQNAGQMLEEKVLECYEKLRPRGYSLTDYKTNQKSAAAGVGQKIILSYTVRPSYHGGKFEVNYRASTDELRALDQVFHLLDGKTAKDASWAGELCDAIHNQTGPGKNDFSTAYFRGRCFGNGNLHLEFTRADLVEKFNIIAGGARLPETAHHGKNK